MGYIEDYLKIQKEKLRLQEENEACVTDVTPSVTHLGSYDNKYIKNIDIDDVKKDITNNQLKFNNISFDDKEIFAENLDVLNEADTSRMTKRQRIEKKILDVINIMDRTGKNGAWYKNFLGKMSDKEFNSYMDKFLHDDEENFYMEIQANRNEPTFKEIKKASDYLNIELDEYIYYKHDGHKDNPIRTPYKVPVGYIPVQRMQQTLSKKNTYSLDISKRNLKTGSLTGEDRIARISDMETFSLTVIGADSALKEFLSPRSDNSENKASMYRDISLYGYTYLKDLPDETKGQAITTTSVYLLGAGLNNNL